MDNDKKDNKPNIPADALEKTNEQLAADTGVIDATTPGKEGAEEAAAAKKAKKRGGPARKFFRKVDIYLLATILIIVGATIFSFVNYLNTKKTPPAASINTETITPGTLKTLSSNNVTVSNAAQTVTIQGNAIFNNEVLIRGGLSVAGNIQTGGQLAAPTLTITDTANLAKTQADSLQVAHDATIQGAASASSLTITGPSTFSGPITANTITVTQLIIAGNGQLQVPNHIAFTGATPGTTSNTNLLGPGTVNMSGSDTSGTVNVGTGNNPQPGCFVTINFVQKFNNLPHVMVSPFGAGGGSAGYYVTKTTNSFSICMNTPPHNSSFGFDYFVTGI